MLLMAVTAESQVSGKPQMANMSNQHRMVRSTLLLPMKQRRGRAKAYKRPIKYRNYPRKQR